MSRREVPPLRAAVSENKPLCNALCCRQDEDPTACRYPLATPGNSHAFSRLVVTNRVVRKGRSLLDIVGRPVSPLIGPGA